MSDGQNLIERLSKWIGSYVVLTPEQALVCALWAMHTYVARYFHATPYLEVSATTKRSGKTALLEVLASLSINSYLFATIRPLAIVRLIEALEGDCTIMLDEAEKLHAATLGDTRSMLATGYRKGQYHLVTQGSKMKRYPTYCPKAFALIGNVTGVIRDRCIPIWLERATPARDWTNEHVTAMAEAGDLVVAIRETLSTFERIEIHAPEHLTARAREIWTPLFSLAHMLKLHKASMDLLTSASVDLAMLNTLPAREYHSVQDETDAEDRDAATRVLTDLRTVLQADERAIFSATAVERLRAIPAAPWRSWRGGLDELKLAALLSRFGLHSTTVQVGKGRAGRKVAKGYKRAEIDAAKV